MPDNFLSSFTPSLMSPQDLEAIFVQREKLVEDLIASVKESVTTNNKHYRLLVGMRGIGKTHTIALLYHRLRNEADLQDKLVIAWLKEEEWGVSSWLDLLIRIFQALGNLYPQGYQDKLAADVEALYQLSPDEATARGEIILKEFIAKRTLLILTENLDEILKGLGDTGQKKFRAYLQNKSFITIVATCQNLSNDFKSKKRAFYGFFNINNLDKLSLDEATNLLTKIAQLQKDSELTKFIRSQTGRDRIKAIHHLAGGNHRVYIIFSQFLTRDSLDDLVKPVMQTLDELTPYYQARMQWLSPQQRKIVELLCARRHAVPVKEIAQRCFISHQTASSQLKDLLTKGYVVKETQGRESFYELQEPLMRICLETKKQRGEPIKLFVDFLRIWYTKEELEDRLKQLPDDCLERKYILKVLDCIDKLAQAKANQADDLLKKVMEKYEQKDFDSCILFLNQILEILPNDENIWIFNSILLNKVGRYEESIMSCERSLKINPNDHRYWIHHGRILNNLGRYEDAIKSCDRSIYINSNDDEAWRVRGSSLALLGQYEEVIISFKKIIEIDSDNVQAWNVIGTALNLLDKHKQALDVHNKAIEIDSNNYLSWNFRGEALYKLGKYEEALKSYQKSINIESNDILPLFNLGKVFLKLNLWHEGFTSLEKALAMIEDIEDFYGDTIEIIKIIFTAKIDKSTWIDRLETLVKLYERYQVVSELATGIAKNIPNLLSEMVSNKAARTWLEVWQEVVGDKPELEITLRWLKTAVEYKDTQGDSKVLLQLPKEERDLFVTLLEKVEE